MSSRPTTRRTADPTFEYQPSKNIYWDKLQNPPTELTGLSRNDHQTEIDRGNWRAQFKAKASEEPSKETPLLHVEVGCNGGHVVLEWAKQNPKQRYIGIDWKFKQIYKLAEKCHKSQVENLLAFRANADRLPLMFAPREIDFLYLYFPDPWPKKKHQKNRTADVEWLKSVAPLLSSRGHFHIKTDHRLYFDFIIENLKQLESTYEILELSYDLHEKNPNAQALKIPEVTLFERLFIRDGLPIHCVKIKALNSN